MAAASSDVLTNDLDIDYESEGERSDLQSLTEIFGKERSAEIRRTFLELRHSQPKENRFIEIANALIATVEEEEQNSPTKSMENSATKSAEDNDVSVELKPDDYPNLVNQPSVKPKRQRSDDEINQSDVTLRRGDTEVSFYRQIYLSETYFALKVEKKLKFWI